jgi:hypothetical protein
MRLKPRAIWGMSVANEKTPVLDPKIIVENGLGGGVHLDHKSVLVEGDRGQAHRIDRGGWRSARSARCRDGGALDHFGARLPAAVINPRGVSHEQSLNTKHLFLISPQLEINLTLVSILTPLRAAWVDC